MYRYVKDKQRLEDLADKCKPKGIIKQYLIGPSRKYYEDFEWV